MEIVTKLTDREKLLLLASNIGFPTFDSRCSDLNTGFCLNVFPPLYLAFCSSVSVLPWLLLLGNLVTSRELFGHVVNKAWPSLRRREVVHQKCELVKTGFPPALGENVQARPSIMIGPGGQPDQALSWLDEKLWDRTQTKMPRALWVLEFCSSYM